MPIRTNRREDRRKVFLENVMAMAKNWVRDISFGTEAEKIVYERLAQDGYFVIPLTYKKHKKGIIPTEEKIKHIKEQKFKPDAITFKYPEKKVWFIDPKGKSKLEYVGWVNVRDYNKYWNTLQIFEAISMVILFYNKQTRRIHQHLIDTSTKPDFPIKHQTDGDVYTIPLYLVEPYEGELLSDEKA